jgi:L-ascorbate metabolism protein UlaG (beta-lactamase superfamily)
MISKIKWLLLITSLITITVVLITGCSSLGGSLSKEDEKMYKKSKNFNANKRIFENRIPDINERWKKRVYNYAAFKEFLFGGENRRPNKKLPEQKPSVAKFKVNKDKPQVIWFGHSSFLLSLKGRLILVDPVFSDSASPLSFLNKRFQAPVIDLKDLQEIDYILISHDHYDHLDMESIQFYKNQNIKFLVPLGVSVHLRKWGIAENKIKEFDWWDEFKLDEFRFVFTPAQHFSGRGLFDEAKTLWGSWVIKSQDFNIYFSGDSGYDTHFKEIGDKLGPFDIAFLECGQYNEKWKEVHMMPQDTMQAYFDLRSKKLFPVHWGMFDMAIHAWNDPAQKIYLLAQEKQAEVIIPLIGETIDLNQKYDTKLWWNF